MRGRLLELTVLCLSVAALAAMVWACLRLADGDFVSGAAALCATFAVLHAATDIGRSAALAREAKP